MKRKITAGAVVAAFCVAALLPAQKQPQPKSKAEYDALMAMVQAADADTRIKAAEELVTKFADTEFKSLALYYIAESFQMKGDHDKTILYAERTLEADPNHYQAMLLLSNILAQRTREFDLDKEEKLAAAEKHAKKAMELIPAAPKPNPNLPDEQWEAEKKFNTAQALQSMGMIAMARKNFDSAIDLLKKAADTAPSGKEGYLVRLGVAYRQAGKYDEAIATLDQVMNMADANPQFKQFAQAEKARATQAKSAAKPAEAKKE